jgi:UDP-glucose 4-epimerase
MKVETSDSGGATTSANGDSGLTVAVTGPTGEIGMPFIRALERTPEVKRILGMARSPFDPGLEGWTKVEYRRGDVLDRKSVEDLVAEADVVVHLAFIIMGDDDETREINVEGSRNVFEATVASPARRLVYTSSVAAYGFQGDRELPISEDTPAVGTDDFAYSAQKAAVEKVLNETTTGTSTQVYVMRPSIVAGPHALLLIRNLPYVQMAERLPGVARRLFDVVPILKPILPDNGLPFQLVHEDDVATALRAATLGAGEPGIYNLAADGEITPRDLADELGWYAISVPELAVDATAEIATRIPGMPSQVQWLHALRHPLIMDTTKAKRELGWRPRHDVRDTLRETVAGARRLELLDDELEDVPLAPS